MAEPTDAEDPVRSDDVHGDSVHSDDVANDDVPADDDPTDDEAVGIVGLGPAHVEPEHRSDHEVVDELPEDLNMVEFVGPRTFPNNNRRRIPAVMYIVIGLGVLGVWLAAGDPTPTVNAGLAVAGAALVLFGIYGVATGATLVLDEGDALVAAAGMVTFAVGHASAQQVWRGWMSRPTWRILAYSAEDPPRWRAIVLVDGVSGEVLEWFSEENPEDWEGLDGALTG